MSLAILLIVSDRPADHHGLLFKQKLKKTGHKNKFLIDHLTSKDSHKLVIIPIFLKNVVSFDIFGCKTTVVFKLFYNGVRGCGLIQGLILVLIIMSRNTTAVILIAIYWHEGNEEGYRSIVELTSLISNWDIRRIPRLVRGRGKALQDRWESTTFRAGRGRGKRTEKERKGQTDTERESQRQRLRQKDKSGGGWEKLQF